MNVQKKISQQVTDNAIVLYMKGIPQSPQCGFSAATVQLLNACGVQDFTAVDVLADPEIRDGIKTYSNWPTVPQLYVKGEFIGGADIVREMHEEGELQKLIAAVIA
jgi:monothiol glutaredoxin